MWSTLLETLPLSKRFHFNVTEVSIAHSNE